MTTDPEVRRYLSMSLDALGALASAACRHEDAAELAWRAEQVLAILREEALA